MRDIGGNQRAFSSGKGERRSTDGEVDRAAEDDGDLFLRVLMDRKHRSWLVDVPYQRLVFAVDGLPGDAGQRLFPGNLAPVDGSGVGTRCRTQKTNQPQKSASASRKKKTLDTPPPKMR